MGGSVRILCGTLLILIALFLPLRLTWISPNELQVSQPQSGINFKEVALAYQKIGFTKVSGHYLELAFETQSDEIQVKPPSQSKSNQKASNIPIQHFQGEPILKVLFKPQKDELVFNHLNEENKGFLYRLLEFSERQSLPNLPSPLTPEGKLTEKIMYLITLLIQENAFGHIELEMRKHLLEFQKQEGQPSKSSLRHMDQIFLSVLVLGQRLELDELILIGRSIQDSHHLLQIAAHFQIDPNQTKQWIVCLDQAQASNTTKLLDYIAKWRYEGFPILIQALQSEGPIFKHLLDTQKTLKPTQWSPFSKFNFIHQLNQTDKSTLFHGLRILIGFIGCWLLLSGFENRKLQQDRPSKSFRFVMATIILLFIGLCIEELSYFREPWKIDLNTELLKSHSTPKLESSATTKDTTTEEPMNELSYTFMGIFAFLQIAVFICGLVAVKRISNSTESASIKLKLIDNEEHLFDMGLYIGLGGTVLALILLTLKLQNPGLVSAYTSTLFGLLEVALLKLFFVRPLKRHLIREAAPSA